MIRLIHNRRGVGPILVDDIDDGLPNKTVHRLGSTADPKAYARDGYANSPKQPCYIPYTHPGSTLPGYIDLRQTQRVLHSAAKGSIIKLSQANLISVVGFETADILAPVVTTPDVGATGILTITGTALESFAPYTTTVTITGTGAVTLTEAQIVAGGGHVSGTEIVIPAALIPDVAAVTSSVSVTANNQDSETVACS